MERLLTNGASTDFLHPHSPSHHVRRLATFVEDPPPSPTTRRRRRQRKPWRKLLWVSLHFVKSNSKVKQDYPDNYTDSSFLEELQRNGSPASCCSTDSQLMSEHMLSILSLLQQHI
jgi:Phosphatidylinositol N-acetylglucosaminyltransferase